MFDWVKRIFGDSTKVLTTALIAVAKARVEESLSKTDKFDETEKAIFREAIESFATELLKEINS